MPPQPHGRLKARRQIAPPAGPNPHNPYGIQLKAGAKGHDLERPSRDRDPVAVSALGLVVQHRLLGQLTLEKIHSDDLLSARHHNHALAAHALGLV